MIKKISEFKKGNMLLTDDDIFIDLDKVKKSVCILGDFDYHDKTIVKTYKKNTYNTILNIKTLYVKKYFLLLDDSSNISNQEITGILNKCKILKRGRGKFKDFFKIDYSTIDLDNGKIYLRDLTINEFLHKNNNSEILIDFENQFDGF